MKKSDRVAYARDLVFWRSQLESVDDSDGLIEQRIESHKNVLGRGVVGRLAVFRAQLEANALHKKESKHPVIAERRAQASIMAEPTLIPVGEVAVLHVVEEPAEETLAAEPLAA